MNLPKQMAAKGLVISCSEARRLICTGHVAVNGELAEDISAEASDDDVIEIVPRRKVNRCNCNKIAMRMECLKCGYPYSEAMVGDDGTECTCEHCK